MKIKQKLINLYLWWDDHVHIMDRIQWYLVYRIRPKLFVDVFCPKCNEYTFHTFDKGVHTNDKLWCRLCGARINDLVIHRFGTTDFKRFNHDEISDKQVGK